jgi:hypothetical protein
MTLKNQDFAALIESQIGVWQGQIKEHQERLSQAGAEGRANYEKAVAGMRENTEQTGKLLLKVRDANEGAWKEMQTATQNAFERLQTGWADALKAVAA